MKTNQPTCVHGRPSKTPLGHWPDGFDVPGPCERPHCKATNAWFKFAETLAQAYWACGFATFRILHDETNAAREIRIATGFAGLEMKQSINMELVAYSNTHESLACSMAGMARQAFVYGCWEQLFRGGEMPLAEMKENVEHIVASSFTSTVESTTAMAKRLDERCREVEELKKLAKDLAAEVKALRAQRKPTSN